MTGRLQDLVWSDLCLTRTQLGFRCSFLSDHCCLMHKKGLWSKHDPIVEKSFWFILGLQQWDGAAAIRLWQWGTWTIWNRTPRLPQWIGLQAKSVPFYEAWTFPSLASSIRKCHKSQFPAHTPPRTKYFGWDWSKIDKSVTPRCFELSCLIKGSPFFSQLI